MRRPSLALGLPCGARSPGPRANSLHSLRSCCSNRRASHPLAASSIGTPLPRSASLHSSLLAVFLAFEPPRTLVLELWLRRWRTSHPSGSRPSGLSTIGPLAAPAAPENPLFPIASNPSGLIDRTELWLRRCAALQCSGAPTPCGSRCGRSEIIGKGGTGWGMQSDVLVAPDSRRHCLSRPIEHSSCPYAKALDTSNGWASLITW